MSYITTLLLLLCLPVAVAALYIVKTGKNVNINTKLLKIIATLDKK